PVTATGGTPPLTFTLSGTLPSGIRFDPVTGQISGTPNETHGTTTYTVRVTDVAKATAQNTFELDVTAANPIVAFLSSYNVSIRKTFDGSKDEQTPASIFHYWRPTGPDKEFSST